MRIHRYTVWPCSPHSRFDIMNQMIGKRKPDRVDFFGPEEWTHWWNKHRDSKYFEEQARDRELRFIVGSFPNQWLEEYLPPNTKIIYWSTYWISATWLQTQYETQFDISGPITVPFMSLNNKPHPHRCGVMDELVRRGMDKDAYISWHEPNVEYDWKHWSPKKLEVDRYGHPSHLNKNGNASSFTWSKEFEQIMSSSFMSLITESTMDSPFLTEKTFQQIFYKRPFLSFSTAKVYAELDKLGFKRYDEVFDYSFDDVEDDSQRGKMIIDEVEKIIGQDYEALTKKLRPKLEHNYKRALEIVGDKSYVPDEIKLSVKENPNFNSTYTKICAVTVYQEDQNKSKKSKSKT